ncbi:molybdopterin synthase catalytic subunit [Drosophila biarmipes]|uniref:molybdopterin synthase catalytic subunit n=1 Tax=Drosophila biarmipes TaxID=125945 RepID=UPI0007E8B246|nr:molybdopterin synthase catalytic subunit [Drosophila biarmipes]
MDHVKLVNNPIDIAHIHQLLADEGCGASSVFVGTTRDNFQGKKVVSLAYEAYDNMALKEMNKICSDLRSKWPELKHIVIYHRLGTVPVCEASVVIAASSPHRSEALESVAFAIDQLKTRVPIWKKEIYEGDHGSEWKENKESIRPKKSKSAFNYAACPCKVEESHDVPRNLVQIRVNDAELAKRLECFVNRKRDEINSQNVIDFKSSFALSDKDLSDSCARTQSTIIKQEQSNCHLKVRRVNNRCGPQQMELRPNYELELNKLMGSRDGHSDPSKEMRKSLPNSRLQAIESYMGLSTDNEENIFSRIKKVENRMLQLESISPEYRHFTNLVPQSMEPPPPKKIRKKSYSAHELSVFIQKMKDGREINE